MDADDNIPRIIILGGGFGGLFAARYLHQYVGNRAHIELISDLNYFVFQPLLPEVAAGTINAQDAVSPLRQLLPNVSVRLATVLDIDTENNEITLIQGQKRKLQTLRYDELIITTGQTTKLSMFTGFEHHSLTMKTLSDAYRLRNHVIQCMEMADVTKFSDIKQRALTFVVAGGGFSGVETMGELMEMIHRVRHQYPNIQADDIRAVLIQRGNRLLPEMSEKLGEFALKKLQQRGVEVWLATGIQSASRYSVSTTDGRRLATHTIVTTIGNGPSPFIEALPISLKRGKIPVNAYLQVEGLKNVWSVGDAALIPVSQIGGEEPHYAPPTAQFARQESKTLARNIAAQFNGKKLHAFSYTSKGSLASLGGYSGVAEIGGFHFTGIVAWLLWRFIYIGMVPGLAAKIRIALNWLFDYFLPRTIVCMSQAVEPAMRLINFAANETVHEVDEVLEGFYVVTSGRFERTIPGNNGQEDKIRIFSQGDSWGERCIADHRLTIGRVKALEDSEVLLIKAEDFERMRTGFNSFDELITHLHQ